MKVLVILGHPRTDSFCAALADAYCRGAAEVGVQVRRLVLAELRFELNVTTVSPRDQHDEPDVLLARRLVSWADHLVFVYPTWWGSWPALLKAFLDRVLAPGFAFRDREEGGWEPLLGGMSAHLVTTMDTPGWVYRWIYGSPGHRALGRATLGFCGVGPVRVTRCGPIKGATPGRRRAWLESLRREGARLGKGALTPGQRVRRKTGAWLRAVRLQFYPMTWIAYTVGALAALPGGGVFANPRYWLGYGFLFFLEAATVLSNEYLDYASDRRNRHYGPFSGGSRVLVENRLSFAEVRAGSALAVLVAGVFGTTLLVLAPGAGLLALMSVMAALALGYTLPPLKLSYRGLGELDVAITHSVGVLLCGYVFLGGAVTDALPWLVAVPLFLAVLPSIILAGAPDADADRDVAKGTLAVRLGRRAAAAVALEFTLLSALIALVWQWTGVAGGAFAGIGYFVVPHAILLAVLIYRYARAPRPGRIDGLMAVALTYLLWFGLLPLLAFI